MHNAQNNFVFDLINLTCTNNFLFHIHVTKLFIQVYANYLQTEKCCTKSYLEHVI